MTTVTCQKRGACGVTCDDGPCPLLANWVRKMRDARRARAELGAMSDRELGDIGLHRSHIDAVAAGTFTR